MSKIVISWMGYYADFVMKRNEKSGSLESSDIVDEGKSHNYLLHQYYYQPHAYDKHIILTTASSVKEDMRKTEALAEKIREDFGSPVKAVKGKPARVAHQLEVEYLGITDNDFLNLQEIHEAVTNFVMQYKDAQIDLLLGAGGAASQLSFFLVHTNLGLHTQLVQIKPSKFTKRKSEPEWVSLEIQRSNQAVALAIREKNYQEETSRQTFMADGKLLLKSPSIEPVYQLATLVAKSRFKVPAPVLIYGETGTGKESLARHIHDNSARKGGPYKAINCAAFTDELLRTELFGYAPGTFTGGLKEGKKGLFEEANGGTVFLDEIGEITPFMQQSLLRALQERKISPVGSAKEIAIDVQVVSATNRNLIEACHAGKFRWDLYYRLAGVVLPPLPPLNKRRQPGELESYLDFFLESRKENLPLLQLDEETRARLLAYSYPGNIRQMQNIVETLYLFCNEGKLTSQAYDYLFDNPFSPLHLPPHNAPAAGTTPPLAAAPALVKPELTTMRLKQALAQYEKSHIERILRHHGNNKKKTAKALGMAYNTLVDRISKHQIQIFEKRE